MTFVGARDQIERQLKERKDIPHEKVRAAASYLAKKVKFFVSFVVFEPTSVVCVIQVPLSIGDTFKGAKAIQTWLNLCARVISLLLAVNCVKQASAFPPNFIHSLEVTHMMLTTLECRVRWI